MVTRRDVLSAAGALSTGALLNELAPTEGVSAAIAAATPSADPVAMVNPEFRPALEELIERMKHYTPLNAETLPKAREMMKESSLPALPSPAVAEHTIPGGAGAPALRVYVAGAAPGASRPAVLHIHGGGYVMGSAEAARRGIQELSTALECVAISVEYRLAPETHFPGSLEDNYAALRWMHSNARELGIDVKRIAIKGESAGGGHAAALAIAARDRGDLSICFQVLIYPMLDDRTGSSRSLPPYLGHYVWTPQQNRFGWTSLLGVPAGSSEVPPNAVPARVSNLAGLAPAFIGVGSIDLFAPEDMQYAQRLILAGVPVEMDIVPGGFHGFDGLVPNAPLSQDFVRAWHGALQRAFGQD